MEMRIFWDVFSTPDNMNSKRWMIKRCTDMRKHFKQGKEYDQHWKLDLSPPEKKRTKNNRLEASLASSWESPGKNIDGKEWRNFTSINGYMIKKSESLRKEGGRAGKTKTTWDGWSKHCCKELRIDLANVEMIKSTWREARRMEKNWHDNLDDQEGLVST